MNNKNTISEEEKFKLGVTKADLKDPQTTKELGKLQSTNKNIDIVLTKGGESDLSDLFETDEVIEPKDQATIKYLSNVKDSNTNEVSKPFTIGNKKYQMVRGITPSKEIVMGVYCHDDMDDNGENIIHSIDLFEKHIVKNMQEITNYDNRMVGETSYKDTYEGFKHYLVNKQTNEIRKFKTIEELLSNNKLDEEEYMGTSGFKKYMTEKLFGARKRKDEFLTEVTPTGDESDEEMNIKAKKLMDMISKRIPQNVIKTIVTPVAQREVIAAFAELIGVPRNGLSNLISSLKDISKDVQPALTESKIITKKELMESLSSKKTVIKKIKVKDIK